MENPDITPPSGDFVCGAVAVLGKPNVGKSTFLNAALGQKLAIVSPRPQTTRGSMAGVYQDGDSQIVFYDTPGIHQPQNELSHFMLRQVEEVLEGADAALFLMDARLGVTDEDRLVADWLKKSKGPAWVVMNKSDQVPLTRLGEVADRVRAELGDWPIRSMSAKTGRGVKDLLAEIKRGLPKQPPLFPPEELTDKHLRDLAGELVREQCFLQLKEEIPYGVAVVVEKYEEREPPAPILVQATIYAERDSQKGILIGAGGKQLKSIGSAARREIEALTGRKVFLELWVKVLKNWRKDEAVLRRLGYQPPKKKRR
ncbi:MAG TPA: GTPase Era [bacterium]|nr:GTPase Era [bacterium]